MPSKKKPTPDPTESNPADYDLATSGDTRAQARVMARSLAQLASVPAPVGDPVIDRLWRAYLGTRTERRLNFMCTLDLYAAHTRAEDTSEPMATLIRAWREPPRSGPKTKKQHNVWQLVAEVWEAREGEVVAWSRFKKIWSEYDGPKHARRAAD